MSKKPVIGITLDCAINSQRNKYSEFPWYALNTKCPDAIIKAGGVPILLPHNHNGIEEMLSLVDGILIPGGVEDINPKFYNQKVLSSTITTNDERAEFELALTKAALAKDIPFLGICNGMQVLNVSLGGDLIQHIPDFIKSDINHEQPKPKHVASHLIDIKQGTLLSRIAAGKTEVMVNSTHHQAVRNLGQGLITSAKAPDEIIEAIELPSHKFVLGVEWHPEHLEQNDLNFDIFQEFIRAC